MKANVGGMDRTLRIVAGFVVIGAGLYFKSWWGAIGLVPLFTGIFGYCPAYLPFGWSSCPAKDGKKA